MNAITSIVSSLVEAWGEVKVAKSRVILSLVGVVAAVAALSTVIALGELTVQANKEMVEAGNGRAVTLRINAYQSGGEEGSTAGDTLDPSASGRAPGAGADASATGGGQALDAQGLPPDRMGDAMTTVAERFAIPYWSRSESSSIEIEELTQIEQTGSFRGRPAIIRDPMLVERSAQIKAVDPAYATIFRLEPAQGRWIAPGDADLRVVPVVINSVLWDYLGRSPIEDPIVLHSKDGSVSFRVVGVIKAKTPWASPEFYVDYTAWRYTKVATYSVGSQSGPFSNGSMMGSGSGQTEMVVWVGPDKVEQAREALPKALASVLGKGWKGEVYGGDDWDGGESEFGAIRKIIMVTGGIVILLGAMGLLNVAIVTVRQRIREIGIRRAMGASAKRVFFSVFMESVVATFVAGVIGVGIAIVIVRTLPLETLGLLLQDRPAFPMKAAVDGVGIATGIGALCGIIPAVAAVKVKPIDAIRY